MKILARVINLTIIKKKLEGGGGGPEQEPAKEDIPQNQRKTRENTQSEAKEEKDKKYRCRQAKTVHSKQLKSRHTFSCRFSKITSLRKPSKLIDVCNKNVNKHTSQQGTLHADVESPTQVSGVRINLTDVPGLNFMNFKQVSQLSS